jgi:hypothetical protein
MSLKQSCSPRQELFNGMSHATCTQGNRINSRLLVVRSQTANLTLAPSFGHNLCFKCPNGSYKPILDIYVSIAFQWYKKLFEPLGFDPCNCPLNIRESIKTPIPKVEAPLGVWGFIPSHFPSLPGFPFWPATLQALALITSPRLGLRHIDWLIEFKKKNLWN